MAWPSACPDQDGGPVVTAIRQLNADVLSASIEASSLAPYLSTGSIARIGNRCANNDEKTLATASVTSACTINEPLCTWPSNPQYRSVTRRSRSGPTGQPSCHDAPSSAAVTGWIAASNVATGAVVGGDVAGASVGGVVGASVSGTFGGATVFRVDRPLDRGSSPDPPLHAAAVASIRTVTATEPRVRRRCVSPAARAGTRSRRAKARPRPLRRACPARCVAP